MKKHQKHMWWSTYDPSEVSCQPGTSKNIPKKDTWTKVKNKIKETKHTPLSDMSSTDNTENIKDTGVEVSAPVNPDLVIAPQPNEGDRLKKVFFGGRAARDQRILSGAQAAVPLDNSGTD